MNLALEVKNKLQRYTLFIALFCASTNAQPYSGGSGCPEDPYRISSVADWLSLTSNYEDWDRYFILTQDLDFENQFISPIGVSNIFPFRGYFDGQNYTIRNIAIYKPTSENVGLFGYISSGYIINLKIENIDIIGNYNVGGIAGYIYNSTISYCKVSGVIQGTSIAGLIGNAYKSNIISCSVNCQLEGLDCAGLINQLNECMVASCSSSGTIFSSRNSGGIANISYKGIYASSYSSCCIAVSASAEAFCVGGFIASSSHDNLTQCFFVGSLQINEEILFPSYASGGSFFIGGLIGINYLGIVNRCYSNVLINTNAVFSYDGIRYLYVPFGIGGLVGKNTGAIASCFSESQVTITCEIQNGFRMSVAISAGGLVGWNPEGQINSCYAKGQILTNHGIAGGLVGTNGEEYKGNLEVSIANSFADGSVAGANSGGLVGYNLGTIINCYSSGEVYGTALAGGLIGSNYQGKIKYCYSTSNPVLGQIRGGFCGAANNGGNYEDVSNFWDIEKSEITISAMGIGKTTNEMKILTTFLSAGWNISDIFNYDSVWKKPISDYPRLDWENIPANLIISDVPDKVSLGTGEIGQFNFTICRKELGETTFWNIQTDQGISWVSSILPQNGLTSSPSEKTVVTVIIIPSTLQEGNYPIRLLISDGYIYYEVAVLLHIFNRVNIEELGMLSTYWLKMACSDGQPCGAVDWYLDGKIDLADLIQLSMSWMSEKIVIDRPGMQDDFESGTFEVLPWLFAGNKGWQIDETKAFEGQKSARSGLISDFQTSALILEIDTEQGRRVNTISFARKVSSEANYDFLRFYIDGIEVAKWSGQQDWATVTFSFNSGAHIFKWSYTKDGSISFGEDCGWIDLVSIYAKP